MNTILAFLFALEMGFIPYNSQINWIDNNNFKSFTILEAGFLICDLFYIKGTIKTFEELSSDSFSFYPHQADYYFDIGIRYEFFSFGFRHACFHPINIGCNINHGYLGQTDEIYFRIESNVKLF